MNALALVLVLAAQGGDWLEVEASFGIAENREVKVGEPFKLIVTARHSPGGIALLPSPLGLGDELAERVDARVHTRTTEGEAQIDRYELELLAFDRGMITIPPLPLAMGAVTATTAALELTIASGFEGEELEAVSSTQAEATQILENLAAQNPPAQTVMVPEYTLFWVLGFVVLLIVTVLILRATANRERAPVPEPPPPPRPAHEVALEQLGALRAANHLDGGDYKRFYTELSAIMRTYAGGRYHFDSLDLTVDELMQILADRSTAGLDEKKIEHLLRLTDQVKFAKFVPTRADGDALLDDAVAVVEATRPQREDLA